MTYPRYAIVNADDFGFSQGVNQAIVKAHQQGILTSTSLMVTGNAVEEAVRLAEQNPTLGVGLHLVLVCGQSALQPRQIPHLVDRAGNFSNNPALAGFRYQFSTDARAELKREIRAQLETFHATGLSLSHVDGHLHLHLHPVVLNILLELSTEFQIKMIRLPWEELTLNLRFNRNQWMIKLLYAWIFGQLRRYGERRLRAYNISFMERVYGLYQTGQMTEAYLLDLIPQISANGVEIYAHPAIALPGEPLNGPCGSGEKELSALLSQPVRQMLNDYGFTLTNYPAWMAVAQQ